MFIVCIKLRVIWASKSLYSLLLSYVTRIYVFLSLLFDFCYLIFLILFIYVFCSIPTVNKEYIYIKVGIIVYRMYTSHNGKEWLFYIVTFCVSLS